jgi:hypothetical protein
MGSGRGTSVQVEGAVLLGVRVTAHVVINVAEHQRREAAGITAVTDPALLDRLLDLPLAVPVNDPVIWAKMADQPPGIVERGGHSSSVTRLLQPPVTIEDVVVNAAAGRELGAVQEASLFAGFARRWISTAHSPMPDGAQLPAAVQLEAKLCGVGILDHGCHALLPAETPGALTVDAWSWLLQEKVYRRWLSQRPQTHVTESQPPAIGEASASRAG